MFSWLTRLWYHVVTFVKLFLTSWASDDISPCILWETSQTDWHICIFTFLAVSPTCLARRHPHCTGCESATHSHILSTIPCLLLLLLPAGWGPGLFPPPTSLPRSHFHLVFCKLVSSSSTPSPSSSTPSSHQMELSAASDKPVPPFSHPLSTYLNSQPDKKVHNLLPCQFEILNLNNLLFHFLTLVIARNSYDSSIPVHFVFTDSVSEARWQFCWTLNSFFVVFWMNNCKLCPSCNSEYLMIAVSSDVLLVINICSVIKLDGLNKEISISIKVKRVFFSIKTFTWMMIWRLKNTTKHKYKHTETATARVSDKCPFYPILGNLAFPACAT